jgi:hypothetical protein
MSAFGGKADIDRKPDHTFKILLQICESRVDHFLVQVNFIRLMRY